MKPKIEPGLIFAIRLLNGKYGFGQLIAKQRPIFYMAAFDIQREAPVIEDSVIQQSRPVFLGNFFDVLIRNGRWVPLQQTTPLQAPRPCFKILIDGAYYVESWDRQRQRKASDAEVARLQPPSNYGPILLEYALNAFFGLSPWEAYFEPLKADRVAEFSGLR